MTETVLVIAPHPDDEAIGCGGMICLHRRRRDRVNVVFLTSGERGVNGTPRKVAAVIREAEARRAARVLGIEEIDFLRLPDLRLAENVELAAASLRPILTRQRPSIVYLPHAAESHPDHGAALPAVRTALSGLPRRVARGAELRTYEVWSPMSRYGWVEDITAVMARKLRAVRCHRSQLHSFRYDHAVRGLNLYRGVMGAGSRYAEAFAYAATVAGKTDD